LLGLFVETLLSKRRGVCLQELRLRLNFYWH
jgi:hypothetical protein